MPRQPVKKACGSLQGCLAAYWRGPLDAATGRKLILGSVFRNALFHFFKDFIDCVFQCGACQVGLVDSDVFNVGIHEGGPVEIGAMPQAAGHVCIGEVSFWLVGG